MGSEMCIRDSRSDDSQGHLDPDPPHLARSQVMIRRASVADLDAVMAVEQASFDPPWSRASWAEEIAAADHRLTLVAGDDEVAAAATFHGFDVADLDRIMVTPAARGRGLAVALLSGGLDWAVCRGCRAMMLEVRRDNYPAISLYRRCLLYTSPSPRDS